MNKLLRIALTFVIKTLLRIVKSRVILTYILKILYLYNDIQDIYYVYKVDNLNVHLIIFFDELVDEENNKNQGEK